MKNKQISHPISTAYHSMKHLLLLILLLTLNDVYGQQANELTEIVHFGNNPGNLKMFMHNNSPKGANKLPLVIVLHGCGENAQSVSELTGWNKLADLNDFIVLYPQQKFQNNADLCFNWFKDEDIEKNRGECESIYQMISYAADHFAIDSNRIFITGISAGAAMGVVMMATHPELFKYGAIFAGGAYKIATNATDAYRAMRGKELIPKEKLVNTVRQQNPGFRGKYPAMIIYQGMNDPVVNHNNVTYLIDQWTGLYNCDKKPEKVEPAYMGIEDITRSEFADTSGITIIILYEVNNLGHRLMIKPGDKENEGGQTGIFGVDKGFHSTYQTAKEFGIIKKY
jgi:poly(hydroxyalkanoate) depolymerase family esterase